MCPPAPHPAPASGGAVHRGVQGGGEGCTGGAGEGRGAWEGRGGGELQVFLLFSNSKVFSSFWLIMTMFSSSSESCPMQYRKVSAGVDDRQYRLVSPRRSGPGGRPVWLILYPPLYPTLSILLPQDRLMPENQYLVDFFKPKFYTLRLNGWSWTDFEKSNPFLVTCLSSQCY